MLNVNEISDENLIEEFKKNDEDIETYISNDKYDDDILSDSVAMYLKEIENYPLLTKDEETKLSNKLKFPNEKKLLLMELKDGYSISSLNIKLLFKSLCNNKSYDVIVNSILSYYNSINENDDVVNLLRKYKKISLKLNRSLNEEELLQNFSFKNKIGRAHV